MAHVLNDWRKTALGAGALAVVAILFTHEGGVAETAATGAAELAARKQAEIQSGAQAHKAWFAANESDYEVQAAPPVQRAPAPVLSAEVRRNEEPAGADFPAGLTPPA